MLTLELVLKALKRSKSFSIIFILNFSLAIASLSYLQFFKASIDSSLDAKAKSLLGADLVVSSRFPISDEQIINLKQKLPEIKNFSQGVSTVSMVSSKTRARLMELVKVETNFPYYGGLVFHDKTKYPNQAPMPKDDEVWVYKEVLDLLDLKLGQKIKIGKESFIVSKIIESDTLKAVSFSGFMPKIYLSEAALKKSGLLQFGSTARYKLNYQFSKNFDNKELEKIEEDLEKSIDQNLRVLSPNDGRDRLLRVLNFITNFLSLVSLISFFLGLVGLIYLYSGFLRRHQNDINILSDLGVSKKVISFTYLLHLFILVLISSIIVFLSIFLTANFLGPFIQKLIGFEFTFNLEYLFFVKSFFVLLLLSLSVGIPLILPLVQRKKFGNLKTFLIFTPFIAILLLIAHFVTPSKNVGLFFALIILSLIALFFFIGAFLLQKFDFSGHFKNLSISLAIKNITRERQTSLSLFVAILLCTTFFSLIPQVGTSLSSALTQSAQERPRFFVLDIKEEDLTLLQKDVKSLGATLQNISPMVRGRIIKINGKDFANAKVANGYDGRLRGGAVNLSYRNSLRASEKIVQGKEFSGKYDSLDFSKPVELSVEEGFAKRRGIKLKDKIVFDVLGLEIEANVVNIRTVNWLEFVPNFFFILQEGAIDDAPKVLLATIPSGDYNPTNLLLSLTEAFPSLTIIDVKNIFETFAQLVKSVVKITDNMSFYSIAVGLIMSFIIIQYQMNLQKNNILRLKMIGIKNRVVKNSFLIEYGLISLFASALGVVLGSLGSYIISNTLFESYWDLRIMVVAGYLFLIPLLTILVVSLFTTRVINQKENVLFGE